MESASKELTEFDSIICDSRIQMLKSAIPFIGSREQRFLSIYVKYIELTKTIQLVKNMKSDSISICSLSNKKAENNDFIQTIRKYCSDSERETIDMITNLLNAYKMLRLYKETTSTESVRSSDSLNESSPSHTDNSIINFLKGQLSPEQQEMLDMYSALLNP